MILCNCVFVFVWYCLYLCFNISGTNQHGDSTLELKSSVLTALYIGSVNWNRRSLRFTQAHWPLIASGEELYASLVPRPSIT